MLVVVLVTGCVEPNVSFRCTDSSQCKGGAGTCESTGFCGFDDSGCPSGRRYGEFASAELSNSCVINPMGDFDISAVSSSNTSITVTFSAPPDPGAATQLARYSVNGLTLSGPPVLAGAAVTIATSVQSSITYTVTASDITRASDAAPLWVKSADFAGRAPFELTSALSTNNGVVQLTFQAPPDPTTGTNIANYSIPGLALSGTPVISGNTVTLTTSPQSAISYTATVTGVKRATDSEALTVNTATFTGRTSFSVVSATSLTSSTVLVTFDAAPNAVAATTLANYSIPGLTLLGTPALTGNSVLLTTTAQTSITYTVTVTGVTRATDGETLLVAAASFGGGSTFNVASAAATTSVTITVTFSGAPNPTQATTLANYSVPGLVLSGTPLLSGNTVTLTTSAQSATTYTVTVANVTRASDAEPLSTTTAMFTGRAPFNVVSAVSVGNQSVQVTFDSAPNTAQAMLLANYSIPGLTLSGTPVVAGSTVTLTTSGQSAISYTVTAANITRQSDGEALTATSSSFTGRTSFDVSSATSLTSTSFRITFSQAPNVAQAMTVANYSVPGLTLSAPVVSTNTVTFTTTPQSAITYTVTVSNVTRLSDGEALTTTSTNFGGRAPFDVVGASSANNVAITVTFSAPPDPAQATNVNNYSVVGLALSGTPVLAGNTVTITSASQSITNYTVAVAGVTRASDGELLTTTSAMFTGKIGFNVSSANSVNGTTMSVTFDAAPNPLEAGTLANYTVNGLALSGTPMLAGNTVTITTAMQTATTYTVVVSGITRNSDASPLGANSASFTHITFNVTSANSVTSHSISVTFDAAPNVAAATTLGNYTVAGLLLSGTPVLAGNTVTITTSTQAAIPYTVNVANVTRASDGTLMTMASGNFTGRTQFDVISAASTSGGSMTVTFSDPPNAALATNPNNYSVPGLTFAGTPQLAGNTVTLTTSGQAATPYTVTVSNVLRASDSEPLTTTSASFMGTALQLPTVTNVAITATSPNNGTAKYFNTGTVTVTITGTEFVGVSCPSGVGLDDRNGAGILISTRATSCTVNSQTQITATFPRGIRTNAALGWNVQVTNGVGTNATSAVPLVPYAGLVVSEVLQGKSGGSGAGHEFIEVYNATNLSINVSTLGMQLHIRDAAGTDTALALTYAKTTVISHGFFLIVSTASSNSDPWYAPRDAEYNDGIAQLVANGGVYLSLSAGAQFSVLDKVGWGTQPAAGVEGTAATNMALDNSIQRKPAGGAGAGTDTDVNSADFLAPSTLITPLGTLAPAQP